IRNGARQLRKDHARAVRMHSGEEGAAPGRAARLGVVVHEYAAFVADAVDIGRLAHHQTTMVDARLHPAYIIAHDEQDVWFFILCLASSDRAKKRSRGYKQR